MYCRHAGCFAIAKRWCAQADQDRTCPRCSRRPSIAAHSLRSTRFNIEIARIPDAVSEPLAGEVRLQWWSEAIDDQRPEEMRGHPIATALAEVIDRYRLPRRLFDDLIDDAEGPFRPRAVRQRRRA